MENTTKARAEVQQMELQTVKESITKTLSETLIKINGTNNKVLVQADLLTLQIEMETYLKLLSEKVRN